MNKCEKCIYYKSKIDECHKDDVAEKPNSEGCERLLQLDDKVEYDVFPQGTGFTGILTMNTKGIYIIKSTGKSRTDFIKQGIATEVPVDMCHDIRRIVKK